MPTMMVRTCSDRTCAVAVDAQGERARKAGADGPRRGGWMRRCCGTADEGTAHPPQISSPFTNFIFPQGKLFQMWTGGGAGLGSIHIRSIPVSSRPLEKWGKWGK